MANVTLESLAEANRSLRTCLNVTLFVLLVLTGSLFIFFRWELGIARRQIDELTKVVSDYEKNTFPQVESFRTKLQAFAQVHPDFAPIYAKYFGATNLPSAGGKASLSNASPARLPPGMNR
jgi:hypothetical protein